jgi:transformer-2 protein
LRTNEEDLERVFGKYGKIERVTVVFDRRINQSRGFGFVYFDTVEAADEARQNTNGMELDGRSIRVDFSTTQKAHEPTPGYYAGKRYV